jgi:hypothetical protein
MNSDNPQDQADKRENPRDQKNFLDSTEEGVDYPDRRALAQANGLQVRKTKEDGGAHNDNYALESRN